MKFVLLIALSLTFLNKLHETTVINQLQEEAYIAYEKKEFRKAITGYEQLIHQYHCKDIRYLYNLANSYFRALQYKQAEKLFKKIIQLKQPLYSSYCYNNLGFIYFQSGQYDKAKSNFITAISLNPKNQEARYNYEATLSTIQENAPFMSNEGRDKKTNERNRKSQQPQPRQTLRNDNSNSGTLGASGNSTQGSSQQQNDEGLSTHRLEEQHLNHQSAEHLLLLLQQREIQYIHQQKPPGQQVEIYPNW